MKDVILKAEAIKRELIILAAMFVIALIMNIYAIVIYDGAWSEMFSQLHIVLLLTIVLYVIVGLVRLIVKGIVKLLRTRIKSTS